jgi:integral membrane protein (TIGR01906 family)
MNPLWFQFHYTYINEQETISIEDGNKAYNNLLSFFYHISDLNPSYWNEKEQLHMKDVQNLYDRAFILFVIFLALLIYTYKKVSLKKKLLFSKIQIISILTLLVLLPIFTYFWIDVFHQLVFDNTYWIYTNQDISYYLFPIEFFKHSLIMLIIVSIGFQLLFQKIVKKLNFINKN